MSQNVTFSEQKTWSSLFFVIMTVIFFIFCDFAVGGIKEQVRPHVVKKGMVENSGTGLENIA